MFSSYDVVVEYDVRSGSPAADVEDKIASLKEHISEVLRAISFSKHWCTLTVTSRDEMKSINNEYMGVDKATDVLSFPYIQSLEPEVLTEPEEIYGVDYARVPDLAKSSLDLGQIYVCVESVIEYGRRGEYRADGYSIGCSAWIDKITSCPPSMLLKANKDAPRDQVELAIVKVLCVHAVLHLVGWDHGEEDGEGMREREEEILKIVMK